jgi:fibronectin type 3 domain-containing protein
MYVRSLVRCLRRHRGSVLVAVALLAGSVVLPLQRSGALASGPVLVRVIPNNAQRVELFGNLHPLAQQSYDSGAVPAAFKMHELKFVLKRSAAQDAALESLLAAQQTVGSPRYHKWLTPEQFGAQFGVGEQDFQAAKTWLQAQGFSVGELPAGRGVLSFSGTAAQVEAAFQTPIHYFTIDGVQHFANTANPQLPAALQPLVAGIRGLHDFRARTNSSSRMVALPDEQIGSDNYVTPTDYAIIYNIQPLYEHGLWGAGVTVAVAAQSDISPTIVTNYWNAYGVYQNQQLSSVAAAAASDPGRTGNANETEAYLDVEIIGALAPKAKIVLVRDKDVITAFEYAINHNIAGIVNVSFSNCEKALGSTNAAVKTAYQQAVAAGMTVIVSSGDSGIAECDASLRNTAGKTVVTGLSVNGLASTPYNIAVGGTDFNPQLVAQGSYWDPSNTPGTFSNARSYIPEMVWNLSCGNPVTASLDGYADALTLCNTPSHSALDLISGSGGGVSSCTSVGSSGACSQGYAAPSWQTGVVGIQGFTSRAIPDLSMLANKWIACDQKATSCGASNQLEIFNGTSAAAPVMSAVAALLDGVEITNANTDGRMGNLNPLLYQAAAGEYGSPSNPNAANLTSCNSSNGVAVGDTCIFYDITAGSNAQPCKVIGYSASSNRPLSTCASASGYTYGIVEVSSSSALAYNAAPGYDLATGLGSMNVAYVIEAIAGIHTPTSLVLTPNGSSVNLSWTGISIAKNYNVYEGTSPAGESSTPIQTGIATTTTTVSGLTPGQTYYFYVTGTTAAGISTYPSEEEFITLPPAAPTGAAATGTATTITLTWNASSAASSYSVLEGSVAGGESSTPVATGITGTSYSMSATAGKTYYFKALAVGQGGNSLASNEVSGMVLPTSPMGLTATAGNASVTLSWTAGSGAASYNIFEGTSSGNEASAAVMSNVTGTTATIKGLANTTQYYFTVTSVNAAGTSTPSNQASAAPTAPSSGGGGSFELFELLLGGAFVLSKTLLPVGRRLQT